MSNPPASPGFVNYQQLTADELNNAFNAKQDYPAITQPAGTNDTTIATTAYVMTAIGGADMAPSTTPPAMDGGTTGTPGVAATYARGDHVHPSDTSLAALAGAAFTGAVTVPTPSTSDSSNAVATTAFVQAAISGAAGVASFNTRTGIVTLTAADVTGVGGALLASPVFIGTPAAPTATAGTNTTQLATTAFVTAAISSANAVAGWTFNLAGNLSTLAATGTLGSVFKVGASSSGNSLLFENAANGSIMMMQDNTSNSALGSNNYLLFQNNTTGNPAVITVGGTDADRNIQLVPVGIGTVQAPTMAPGTNSTAVATTAFVAAQPKPQAVLLSTQVVSGSPSIVQDLTSISGTYSAYEIIIENFVPSTASAVLQLRPYVGGAYPTTSYLGTQTVFLPSGVTVNAQLTDRLDVSNQVFNGYPGVIGKIFFANPAAGFCQFLGTTSHITSTSYATFLSCGAYNAAGAVTGFGLFFSAGTIASGTMKVYGYN